jgi:hypothetical protein
MTFAVEDFSAIRLRMEPRTPRPATPPCSKLINGYGDPPPQVGQPGDFWIDRDRPGHPLYGPKTEAGWPSTPIAFSAPGLA